MLYGGRWSAVSQLLAVDSSHADSSHADSPSIASPTLDVGAPPPPQHFIAWSHLLLERYGIVSREVQRAEEWGAFAPIYKVMRELEEVGRVRRGYFVEGLSAAQFALPGTVDRLRAARISDSWDNSSKPTTLPRTLPVTLLSAVDPAQPFGALLPWPPPRNPQAKLRRASHCYVILVGGQPYLYLRPGSRQAFSFVDAPMPSALALAAVFRQLVQLLRYQRKSRLTIDEVDGHPVRESQLFAALQGAGLDSTPRGLTLRA